MPASGAVMIVLSSITRTPSSTFVNERSSPRSFGPRIIFRTGLILLPP